MSLTLSLAKWGSFCLSLSVLRRVSYPWWIKTCYLMNRWQAITWQLVTAVSNSYLRLWYIHVYGIYIYISQRDWDELKTKQNKNKQTKRPLKIKKQLYRNHKLAYLATVSLLSRHHHPQNIFKTFFSLDEKKRIECGPTQMINCHVK